MEKPLQGIRVVELSTFVAAPTTGRFLADLGAEVIKIEQPQGDGWRDTGYKVGYFSRKHNPVFDLYNSGKKHISLNVKTPEGMEAMHKLLEGADIFITNLRTNALARNGLDYETLKDKYPALIYGLMLGFGEKGPDAELPAFDTTAFWSRGGFLRSLNDADYDVPVTAPAGIGDAFTGYLLLSELLAALFRRSRDGKGELVKAGLYHNAVYGMGTMNIITQEPDPTPRPIARKDGPVHMGAFCCADDEWIYFIKGSVKEYDKKIATILGLEALLEDPRYADPGAIERNREQLYPMFRDAFLKQSSDYWLEKLHAIDVGAVRMVHFSDVSKDEQAWANDYLEHVQFPDGVTGVMPTSPLEMESVGKIVTKPAPMVGHDTVAVLQDLGYSDDEIAQMNDSGAIYSEQ